MPIQILPNYNVERELNKKQERNQAFKSASDYFSGALKEKETKEKQAAALRGQGLPEDYNYLPPDVQKSFAQKVYSTEKPESIGEAALRKLREQQLADLQKKEQMYDDLMGGNQGGMENNSNMQQMPQDNEISSQANSQEKQRKKYPPLYPQSKIEKMSLVNPAVAKSWEAHNKEVNRQMRHDEEVGTKKFEADRSYHTGFSKESEKATDLMRNVIPKKEMSLQFARNAIETGDMGYFSPDKLADSTGIDLFRTAKGAQLLTAGKENLLSNMNRVSAKAQNIWFEQRLNSMFPKIGQSKEANLTVQEMLEGELEMDKAYLSEFDRLRNEDQEKYGYVLKDIDQRARNNTKSVEKQILNRTSYRMKEIEEREKGPKEMESKVGKKVPKGTPLTFGMVKLYMKKFGDKAMKVAEENGYQIPSEDQFKYYSQRFEE